MNTSNFDNLNIDEEDYIFVQCFDSKDKICNELLVYLARNGYKCYSSSGEEDEAVSHFFTEEMELSSAVLCLINKDSFNKQYLLKHIEYALEIDQEIYYAYFDDTQCPAEYEIPAENELHYNEFSTKADFFSAIMQLPIFEECIDLPIYDNKIDKENMLYEFCDGKLEAVKNTEFNIIIDDYIRQHGYMFDFLLDGDKIRIKKYYDDENRHHIKIPDFVYGFNNLPCVPYEHLNNPNYKLPMIEATFESTRHLKSIELGKNTVDLSGMFYKTKIKNIDLSNLDVSKVTNLSYMFCESALENIGDLSSWNVSNVIDMMCMFSASTIASVGDLSSWDTGKVQNMSSLFLFSALENIGDLGLWNVSNVEFMSNMFSMSSFTDVGNLSFWNTEKVRNLNSLFSSTNFKSIGDLSNWNVANAENMGSMFGNSQLIDIGDLSKWNVSNVNDMGYMFFGSSMKTIGDISQWDVSCVDNFICMFCETKFKDVGDLNKWTIAKNADAFDVFENSELERTGKSQKWTRLN